MAQSAYYISIRRHDEAEVKLRPGGQGERDLVRALGEKLSWATTRQSAMDALGEILREQKSEVLP